MSFEDPIMRNLKTIIVLLLSFKVFDLTTIKADADRELKIQACKDKCLMDHFVCMSRCRKMVPKTTRPKCFAKCDEKKELCFRICDNKY